MERFFLNITKLINKFSSVLWSFSFLKFGPKSTLCYPFSAVNTKYISVGKNTYIRSRAWFVVQPENKISEDILSIGSNTYIGRNAHIVAVKSVQIADDVLFADNVFVTDSYHGFEQPNIPIKNQKVKFKSEVFIGAQSWIGENVCVIASKIGKHCVIGANSVVTSDIPDYSMAVGSPARVIKKYNFETQNWEVV